MEQIRRMDRREAIRWMLAAAATVPWLDARSLGAPGSAKGYGQDPKLMEPSNPGDFWPLTFTAEQRATAAALCDVILPADEVSPGASQLHVPEFIEEWVSAPYPKQRADSEVVKRGLAWLERESRSRFRRRFVELTGEQKDQICQRICTEAKAGSRYKRAAQFFTRFRSLTMAGFYTTPEGMKDIRYLGNVALARFDGPPPEVLAYLKL
jgi:gluconate 2-dehydrogenase subunit 3-like protein